MQLTQYAMYHVSALSHAPRGKKQEARGNDNPAHGSFIDSGKKYQPGRIEK
jgi:hypothetical protein